MTLREYLAAKLRADGFDGLCGDGCGCEVDDLFPCSTDAGYMAATCIPGYKRKCEPGQWGECESCGDGPNSFCMTTTKPGETP